jgi:hypothetical protein
MLFVVSSPIFLAEVKTSFTADYKAQADRVMPWVQNSANSIMALFAVVIILSMLFKR